jgi:hypothetical protein
MTWTRKAAAPLSFNLGEAFAALVTGDSSWSWLTGWIPILGNPSVDTDQFCALGPPTTDDLAFTDFSNRNRTPLEAVLSKVLLAGKIRNWVYGRTFSAYCENVVSFGTFADYFSGYVCADHSGLGSWSSGVNPVPAGSTQYRVTFTGVTSGIYHGWQQRIMFYTDAGGSGRVDYNDGHPPTDPSSGFTTGPVSVPASHGWFQVMLIAADSSSVCAGVQIEFNGGGTSTFVPDPPVQPTGVVPPTTKMYESIADLGAELDAQESKLDYLISLAQFQASNTALPAASADAPVDVVPDETIDLTDAVGFVVSLSGIPSGADEAFGLPVKYHRIGRITLGTADGWLPSIEISQNNQVVAPLPPGVTQCSVVVHPPTTATVIVLHPPK